MLTTDEAWVYEKFFVPALFGPWSDAVVDAATLRPGDRVLDVACGTGVLARAAARVMPGAAVVGLDPQEGMLSVARQIAPDIEWRQGTAESLPFEAGAFDAVVSQFGLMFFSDQTAGLREMLRVLRPGGRLTVAVWGSLDRAPAFAALVELLQRLFGQTVADGLRLPFALGDSTRLASLFHAAGAPPPTLVTREGTARFPSLHDWIRAEGQGWLGLSDEQTATLQRAADAELKRFAAADGRAVLDISAHLVTAVKG